MFSVTEPSELPLLDQSNTEETLLLLDGLWLKRGIVLMAYRRGKEKLERNLN